MRKWTISWMNWQYPNCVSDWTHFKWVPFFSFRFLEISLLHDFCTCLANSNFFAWVCLMFVVVKWTIHFSNYFYCVILNLVHKLWVQKKIKQKEWWCHYNGLEVRFEGEILIGPEQNALGIFGNQNKQYKILEKIWQHAGMLERDWKRSIY